MLTLMTVLLAQAPSPERIAVRLPPPPECRVSAGVQVCGYRCLSTASDLRCAATPQGRCEIFAGQIRCWDPPEEVRLHLPANAPAAACIAKYGRHACGWQCASGAETVACAQSPWGKCSTAFGRVACWDPPDALIHQGGEDLGSATCASTNDRVACGWDCKTSFGQVACAQTPVGRCIAHDGRVTCVDPPLPPVNHAPR